MTSLKETSKEPKMSIQSAADFCNITTQAIHKKLKAKDISCPKLANKSYLTFNEAKKLWGFEFNRKIITTEIVKGGTGKTTTVDNVANCINTYGARVLKIDIDPQGNLTDANGVDAEQYPTLIDVLKGEATIQQTIVNVSPGIDIIPSRIENVILASEIVNQRLRLDKVYSQLFGNIVDNYDFIFVDCPPTMDQSVTAATLWSDIILVPLNPDKFSAKGLQILKNEIDTLNKNYDKNIQYKIFLNKYSSKTILSDKAMVSLVSDPHLEGKLLATMIQNSQEIPNYIDFDRNVFSNLKKSSVREDFNRLTLELLDVKPNDLT